MRPDERPLCADPQYDAEDWFAWHGSPEAYRAKTTCMECPLYWDCQAYALEEGVPYGIWGGLDERARARIWARRPGGRPTNFVDSMDAALPRYIIERAS